MDRYGAAAGTSLTAAFRDLGSQAARRGRASTRLPSLHERTRPLGLRQEQRPTNLMGAFLGAHMPGMEAPASGFGSAMRSALGGGYDAIAALWGQPGSFGQMAGAAFTNTDALAGGALAPARDHINRSAARWGVPANLLAAFIARESTGNWARDGRRHVYLPARGYGILPYAGLTDPAIRRVGETPQKLADGVNDMAEQIDAAAELIRLIADNEAKGYGWEGVANVYYSGDPTGGYTPGDSWQHGSTNQYSNQVMNFWRTLEPGANTSGAPSALAGFGQQAGALAAMFGGNDPPISQEMGLTDFARSHLNGMYSYATAYGVQGHAGVDYSMNPGTPLYSPVAGTVVYGGGTNYYTDDRYGRGVPGTGELRIKLDNGDEVILGHMESISVRPGQRVSPGMAVGRSGTANGGHVHLEYRQSTPGKTASGYTAVDPRTALGGAFAGGANSFTATQPRRGLLGTEIADAARLVFDQGFRAQFG